MPQNFLRHYYDVYCLLDDPGVQAFIDTDEYLVHKDKRFPAADEKNLARNPAFLLEDAATREAYTISYERTRALYYREQPSLEAVLARIADNLERL